jgi:hypothetical protein
VKYKYITLLLLPLILSGQVLESLVVEEKHDLVLGMKFPEGTKKQWLWSGSNMFMNGFWDGFHDGLHYRYDNFKKRFPNANDRYWNPKVSYRNKWWHGDPMNGEKFFGSSTFLVWTTDASHKTKTGRMTHALFAVSIPLGHKAKKWYWYLADIAVNWLCRTAGFHTSYSLIFNGMNL